MLGILGQDQGTSAQAAGPSADQRHAPGVDVGAHDEATFTHELGSVDGLATGRGAGVQHAVSRLRIEGPHDEGRCFILDGEPSVGEPGEGRRIATVDQHAGGVQA